jgi:hypothetical protein
MLSGVARAATGGIGGVRTPARYGQQHDEDDGEDVEMGKPAPSGTKAEDVQVHTGSSWKVPETEWYASRNPSDMLAGEHRAGFIRKVYGILAAQMTLTVVMCASAMLVPPIRSMFLSLMAIPYAQFILFIPAICVLCALQSKKAEHPTNYYLLWAFTALMSASVAGICAVYQSAGLGYLILEAFAITAGCFLGLTCYACKSGQDFSWLGGFLSMGLFGLIMFSFLGAIFGFHGGIIFSLFGVALFCGFIVYDTYRILQIYGPDDAIMAAIELYLDIMNLFLYILEFLSSMNSSSD